MDTVGRPASDGEGSYLQVDLPHYTSLGLFVVVVFNNIT